LSQRVTVPSVTLSPRAGKLTDSDMSSPFSLLIFVRMIAGLFEPSARSRYCRVH
jgi:hypothetical protein